MQNTPDYPVVEIPLIEARWIREDGGQQSIHRGADVEEVRRYCREWSSKTGRSYRLFKAREFQHPSEARPKVFATHHNGQICAELVTGWDEVSLEKMYGFPDKRKTFDTYQDAQNVIREWLYPEIHSQRVAEMLSRFVDTLMPHWVAESEAITAMPADEWLEKRLQIVRSKDSYVKAALLSLGFGKKCGRCGGSGDHMYYPGVGTACFKCGGKGEFLPGLDEKLLRRVQRKLKTP